MTATIEHTAETCPGRPCGDGCDHVEFLPDPTVETEVWEPDADRPGFLRRVRTKTVDEVFTELRAALGDTEDIPGCEEYLSVLSTVPAHQQWPDGRIVVFPVTGGSEGRYVHVAVIGAAGKIDTLILGKSFDSVDPVWAFAQRVATILGV